MLEAATCKVVGCASPVIHIGFCSMHYQRLRRHGDPLAGRTPNGKAYKHLHEAIKHAIPEECLIWPFNRDPNGYGRIHHTLIHREVCLIVYGPPPEETSHAAHSCGNGSKGCFNPFHLRWATPVQNEADKLIHGTHNRGEQSGKHKLLTSEVLLIRYFCDNGILSHSKLSKIFNISIGQISRIRNRIDWFWLC